MVRFQEQRGVLRGTHCEQRFQGVDGRDPSQNDENVHCCANSVLVLAVSAMEKRVWTQTIQKEVE